MNSTLNQNVTGLNNNITRNTIIEDTSPQNEKARQRKRETNVHPVTTFTLPPKLLTILPQLSKFGHGYITLRFRFFLHRGG